MKQLTFGWAGSAVLLCGALLAPVKRRQRR